MGLICVLEMYLWQRVKERPDDRGGKGSIDGGGRSGPSMNKA